MRNVVEMVMDLRNLGTFKLRRGGRGSSTDGLCAMEAVAFLEGLEHGAHPACTCPVIAAFVRRANDRMPQNQRQRLIPYLPRLVGTVSAGAEPARVEGAAWHVLTETVPDMLSALGRPDLARSLQSLPGCDWAVARDVAADVARAAKEMDQAAGQAVGWACESVAWIESGALEWAAASVASSVAWSARASVDHRVWDTMFHILDDMLAIDVPAVVDHAGRRTDVAHPAVRAFNVS